MGEPKAFRPDNEKKYNLTTIRTSDVSNGIRQELTALYPPDVNGLGECRWRTPTKKRPIVCFSFILKKVMLRLRSQTYDSDRLL